MKTCSQISFSASFSLPSSIIPAFDCDIFCKFAFFQRIRRSELLMKGGYQLNKTFMDNKRQNLLSGKAGKYTRSHRRSYLTLTPSDPSPRDSNRGNPEYIPKQYLKVNRSHGQSMEASQQRRLKSIENQNEDYIDFNDGKRAKSKKVEKLPLINSNPQLNRKKGLPKSTIESQSRRYLDPTRNTIVNTLERSNRGEIQTKRTCSVNCIHKREISKEKEKNHKKRKTKQMKTEEQMNSLRNYLYAQSKANYPSTQINRYLSQMRDRSENQSKSYKMEVYKTYFGIQPEFYKLQTCYAREIQHPRYNVQSPIISSRQKIPEIPNKEDLPSFIEDYNCLNKDIDITKLIKSPRFLVQYSLSALFFGQMVGDQKEGLGILLQQKKCFEGLFRNNMKIKGLEINHSGVYKGYYYNEKKQGAGEFQWFNGEYYVGDWKEGNRHGNGVWTNSHGDSYNGAWVKGKGEGYGTYIIGGQQYRGQFAEFKKEGWGKQKFINGDTYEGMFRNGQPHGKGTYIWQNGNRYEGQFRDGYRQGKGVLLTPEGFKYHGQFLYQRPEGLCEIFMPNGDIYQGYLKNGRKNGKGTLLLKESDKFLDGFWQDDNFIDSIIS